MEISKRYTPLLGRLFEKIAPKIGAKVVMDAEWGIAGQIIFKNGRKRYFRHSSIDLNPLGSSKIAKDKDFANYFMHQLGYPIIEGKTFFSPEWSSKINSKRDTLAAWEYALNLGLPVIVKPNSQSQGRGVSLARDKESFFRSINEIFQNDRVALVQKYIRGNDYRVVVLDGNVISAYRRIPLNVVGDGKSSISELIESKQLQFTQSGRDTKINSSDPRIIETLSHQQLSLDSVPPHGRSVNLLTNANLSSGGESIDVTTTMHKKFAEISINLTRDMGLRLCGVDLMIDGFIEEEATSFFVIEINAAPGLDHYASSGEDQQKIVESLYLELLKSMEA